MISIDFEFCTDKNKDWGLDEKYKKDFFTMKLFCVAVQSGKFKKVWWLQNAQEREDFIKWFDEHKQEGVIAHAYELAEARCLQQLGFDRIAIDFIDTCTLCRVLNKERVPDNAKGPSYAYSCKEFLGIEIDTDLKDLMRQHCIKDETKGHEEEIMEYCLSDVQYLERLVIACKKRYEEILQSPNTICLGTNKKPSWDAFLCNIGDVITCSMIIADVGIPTSYTAMQKLQKAMTKFRIDYMNQMEEKWHCFKEKKDGTRTLNREVAQALLAKEVPADWKKTDSGLLSTDKKELESLFDCHWPGDRFGEWLYYYNDKIIGKCKGIHDGSWLKNLDGDIMRCPSAKPLAAKTHRWQGETSEGFIPLWTSWTRAAIDPPEGWYAIECDYHSEETAVFGVIYKDPKYLEQYKSGDAYCYNAIAMGLLPPECKSKKLCKTVEQQNMRSTIKTFTLAWQYGQGARSAARVLRCDEALTKDYKQRLEAVYVEGVENRRKLLDGLGEDGTLMFPDGIPICYGPEYGYTTKINGPVQGFGAYILRTVVMRALEAGFKVFATVHDALWILTQDKEDGQRLKQLMETTARELLHDDTLEVGEPFILAHGDHKCEDPEDTKIWNKYISDLQE